MQAVMLTGSTGFIGSHIAERLVRQDARVHLWVRRRNSLIDSLESAGARIFVGYPDDLTALRESLKGTDAVIHCAGVMRALNKEEYFAVNTGLTHKILALIRAPQRLVFVSSQAAAGPSGPDMPLDEDVEPHPVSHYGRSKLLAEDYIKRWGKSNEYNYVILRPGVVYGPRERDLYNYFRWIRRGFLPLIGDGRRQFSIVHVEDLVNAILAAVKQSQTGDTYFVSNDRGCSMLEIGYAIGEALGKAHLVELKLPGFVLDSVASLLDSFSLITRRPALLSRQKTLEMQQAAWLCSNRKIRENMGWEPRVPLDIGIKETARWYIESGWL